MVTKKVFHTFLASFLIHYFHIYRLSGGLVVTMNAFRSSPGSHVFALKVGQINIKIWSQPSSQSPRPSSTNITRL